MLTWMAAGAKIFSMHHLDYFKSQAPERFQIFGGVDWSKWESMGDAFPEWAANRLKVQKERGRTGT